MTKQLRTNKVLNHVAIAIATFALTATSANAEPIGYWKFDEGTGTTVADSSPNGNPATQGGASGSWITGKVGNAYQLGGNTSRFELADSTDLQVTGAVTVSAWVNPTAVSNFGVIAGIDQTGGSANDMYSLKTNNSGSDTLRWDVIGSGTNVGLDSTSTLYGTLGNIGDGWVHVVGVYDPIGFAGLYVNGVLDASTTSVPTSIQSKSTPFQIGQNAADSGYPFNGAVDDIAVYNQALSAAEVAALFNLASEPTLNYDAGQADLLFQVFNGSLAEAPIGALTWKQDSDLGGTAGQIIDLGGGDFFLNLDGTAGVSTLSAPTAVPEPGTFALAAFGLLGLAWCGWQKRKK